MHEYWHILHVSLNEEEDILTFLNNDLKLKAFVPRLVRILKKQGKQIREEKRLFPNYIFVVTELDAESMMTILQNRVKPLFDYVRMIKYKDHSLETLSEEEKQHLSQFLGEEYVIQASEGFIEGGTVTITQGPLKGLESQIVNIDRHKRTAKIKLQMLGQEQFITIGLEILYKH